jgi:hypothetical protein
MEEEQSNQEVRSNNWRGISTMTIDASNPGQRRSKEGAQSPGWERFLLGGSLFI